MDRSLRMLFTVCGGSSNLAVLDDRRRRNGSTGQPPGASIVDGHSEVCEPTHPT